MKYWPCWSMTLTLIFHQNYFCWLAVSTDNLYYNSFWEGPAIYWHPNTLFPILNAKETGPGWASCLGQGERDGIHSPLERVIQSTDINLFFQGLFWSNIFLFMFAEHLASFRRSQTSAKRWGWTTETANSGRALWLCIEGCHKAGKDPFSQKIWACPCCSLKTELANFFS